MGNELYVIRMDSDVAKVPQLSDWLQMIINWVTNMTGASAAEIFLWDPETEELVLSISNGFLKQFKGRRLKPGEGITGRSFLMDKPLIVKNYDEWEDKLPEFADFSLKTEVMAVPIHWQEKIIGVLGVTHENNKSFSDEDLHLILMFVNVTAAAILYERFHTNFENYAGQIEHLTPRETEIYQLLLQGISNPGIAEKLVISRSTVKVHVSNILRKLGVENRVDLIKKTLSSGFDAGIDVIERI